jgi:hypothetical protein
MIWNTQMVSIEPLLFRNGNHIQGGNYGLCPVVSIEPLLFRNGNGGHFRAFTDIEKEPIFEHSVNCTIF